MQSSPVQVLRWVVIALVAGVLVFAGLILRHVVTQDPTTPTTELDRAVFAAEEAVKADPQDGAARIKLAAAYLERNAVTRSVEQARIAVRLEPREPSGFYILGLGLARQGDTDQAIAQLKKAIDMKGQVAQFYQDALVALAHEYEKKNQTREASDSYTRAVTFGPENVLLLVERGGFYERTKDWTKAMDDYASALEYAPDYEPALTRFEALKKEHPDVFKKLQEYYNSPDATATSPAK